jgi:eukaryotic-like serine/threonine-protein kinase
VGKEYRISRRIGVGGMAEVFLAMQRGFGGFEKLVVVKRIFEHLSEDDQFVSMFLEEARLAASLRHPNIVQIFDIDRDHAGYFIVMEYLPGEALADLYDELRSRGEVMPVPIACRVSAAVAAGLHCAHTSTDALGRPQLIVHRDVTPSNIIVCYDGGTRLVDFGVAKARWRNARTQTGFIKGKMSYLAPEQVDEAPVDARTDVFQLGIVLHELITGQRLFRGESDMERMSAVIGQTIPRPSLRNPAVPPALDDIVLRALERDPDRRTPSADALRRELEEFLRSIGEPVSDYDVAEWMQRVFAGRCEARVQLERSCVKEVLENTGERIEIGESAVHSVPMSEAPSPAAALSSSATPTMATVLRRPARHAPVSPRRWRRAAIAAGAFAAAFAIAFAAARSLSAHGPVDDPARYAAAAPVAEPPASPTDDDARAEAEAKAGGDAAASRAAMATAEDAGEPGQAEDTFDVALATVPAEALIELDGEPVGTGYLFRTFPRDGRARELRVSADGYRDAIATFTDAPPPSVIRLTRAAPAGERARLAGDASRQPSDIDSRRRADEDQAKAGDASDEPLRPRTDNLDPWSD